jgi:serine protease Do
MKQILISFAFISFFVTNKEADAQGNKTKQEETIIISGDGNETETTVEIKDGEILIDGKKVSPYNVGKNIKIIKKLGGPNARISLENTIETPEPNDQDFNANARPMLGVKTEATKQNNGALVQEVTANSPADLSGIEKGDVINKVDELVITSPQDLVQAISKHKPGDKIDITIDRSGKEKNMAIILTEKPNETASMFGNDFNMDDMMKTFEKSFGGMNGGKSSFRMFSNGKEITKSDAPKIGIETEDRADEDGVLVTSIVKNSAAEKCGIKIDDVITDIGGNAIKNIDDISEALASMKNKKDIVVNVKRGKKTETLYLNLPVQLRKKEF